MLIESDSITSAIYMSESLPIPKNKHDIAAATALAGVQLGLKLSTWIQGQVLLTLLVLK